MIAFVFNDFLQKGDSLIFALQLVTILNWKTGEEKMGMEIWQVEAVLLCLYGGEITFMQANWFYKVKYVK